MIKSPSDELFNFTDLRVKTEDAEYIQAFQPGVMFLFANTRSIWLKLDQSAPSEEVERMFKLFGGGQQFLGLELKRNGSEQKVNEFSLGSSIRARLNAFHCIYKFADEE
jgi:hypothetical protein